MAATQFGVSFVVLPPGTKHGVIFGKNSNGPFDSYEELIYYKSETPRTLRSTYLDIESDGPHKAVIISKTTNSWGGEMGANECGVVIGNQPIWAKDASDLSERRLTGLDLTRIGLSYGASALEALEAIVKFLSKYGQGGEGKTNFCYQNSFVIVDPNSAWVLETVGPHWAAEEITSGSRCVCNVYTINKIDKQSDGLLDYAKSQGYWDGDGDFNFAKVFNAENDDGRKFYDRACAVLQKNTDKNDFKEIDMFEMLRNDQLHEDKQFPCLSSQVSTLSSIRPCVHWFTATKDPRKSVFKPFIFTPKVLISSHTSIKSENVPPTLYTLHQSAIEKNEVQSLLRSMEENCVEELDEVIETIGSDLSEFDELLKDCIETEVKFYR